LLDHLFWHLATEPSALIGTVFLLGLIIGSFLNVVVFRLPIMLEREWRQQCQEYWNLSETNSISSPDKLPSPFNLIHPSSRCPHCGHLIRAWENIPILSYLWQRGRCTACRQPISLRYPLIEFMTALLSAVCAWQLGWGWPLLGALIFTWILLAAAAIDFDRYLLPDHLTFPLLWLGILLNYGNLYCSLEDSVLGAVLGYLTLWSVYWGFKLITGKEGMGYGDFKLLAALGAWLGATALPLIILLSSLTGAILGITLIVIRGRDRNQPLPFGPFLAIAGWISLLWGTELWTTLLQTF